jgi:hypothetical protein
MPSTSVRHLAFATLLLPGLAHAGNPSFLQLLEVLRDNGTINVEAYTALRQSALADTTVAQPQSSTPPVVAAAQPVASDKPSDAARSTPPQVPAWTQTVRIGGDLRYRHEMIGVEGGADRTRHRIRARLDVSGRVSDTISAGFKLSTGGDDPISGNQTLDLGLSRKEFGVDQAYFRWQPAKGATIVGGKFATPFVRAGSYPLIFDGDLNPEGLAFSYAGKAWFAHAAGYWIEERRGSPDSLLLGGQFGLKTAQQGIDFVAGMSYYNYVNARGMTPFFSGTSEGNTLLAGGYANDFNLLEAFGELEFKAAGRPLRIYSSYVNNLAADRFDDGYVLGISYGKASASDTWEIGYAYQKLAADAVIGAFTDSDYGGGGTDNHGHLIKLGYALSPNWGLNLTCFINETGGDAGTARGFQRLMADMIFKF